jgi:hypothetical protein
MAADTSAGLVEYVYNPETGSACLVYEYDFASPPSGDTLTFRVGGEWCAELCRQEPTSPQHAGWSAETRRPRPTRQIRVGDRTADGIYV